MHRTLAVSGLHLDRAWPELGTSFGTALRTWSRQVLGRVTEIAQKEDAETLLIVGGLFDRANAMHETLVFASDVLGSFPGRVIIAPGKADWAGDLGPYELTTWSANTFIWTTPEYTPSRDVPRLLGSAWTSPHATLADSQVVIPSVQGAALVRAQAADEATHATSGGLPFISSGPTWAPTPGACTIPDLVHDPEQAGGVVVLIDLDRFTVIRWIPIDGQPGRLLDLDVTPVETTDDLNAAIETSCRGEELIKLRLTGTLGPRVLLPGFGGPTLPAGLTLRLGLLQFGDAIADPADHSTEAEFIRAMATVPGPALEQHQSRALGLCALSSSKSGNGHDAYR